MSLYRQIDRQMKRKRQKDSAYSPTNNIYRYIDRKEYRQKESYIQLQIDRLCIIIYKER